MKNSELWENERLGQTEFFINKAIGWCLREYSKFEMAVISMKSKTERGTKTMNAARKELKQRYEQRKIVGGVYLIKNTRGGKTLLEATTDIRGSKNRFDFSQKTGSCADMRIQEDWKKWGADYFVFEVLEEHEKGDSQTMEEFQSDISVLKDIWAEKLSIDRKLVHQRI